MRMLIVVAVCALGASAVAHADVYTWVDRDGNVTVSNVQPPDGARVTKVARTSAADKAASDRARESARDAEMRALADRVRELEQQVQAATAAPPPDVVYPTVPSPNVRFAMQPPPLEVPYPVEQPAPEYAAPDCPPGWISCWGYWSVPGIVVIDNGHGHRSHGGHGGVRGGGRRPVSAGHRMVAATRMR